MTEKGEIVGKRYKLQTMNKFGNWVDFGPFYFNTLESVEVYLEEYKKALKKARLVEVTEKVVKHVG